MRPAVAGAGAGRPRTSRAGGQRPWGGEGNGTMNQMQRKQELAMLALLACPTIGEAARQAGVAKRTLEAWLIEPGFLREFRLLRGRILEQGLNAMVGSIADCIATLKKHLSAERPSDSIRACDVLLARCERFADIVDLKTKMA